MITITVDDAGVLDLIGRIGARMDDMRPVMAEIARAMAASVDRNFAEGGRPARWRPSRRALEQHGQTLMDTRRLSASITPRSSRDRAEAGTNVVYAALMHFGAKRGSLWKGTARVKSHKRTITQAFGRPVKPRMVTVREHSRQAQAPWGDIPPRPFMVIPAEDMEGIREQLARYLTGG